MTTLDPNESIHTWLHVHGYSTVVIDPDDTDTVYVRSTVETAIIDATTIAAKLKNLNAIFDSVSISALHYPIENISLVRIFDCSPDHLLNQHILENAWDRTLN